MSDYGQETAFACPAQQRNMALCRLKVIATQVTGWYSINILQHFSHRINKSRWEKEFMNHVEFFTRILMKNASNVTLCMKEYKK